MRAYNTFGTRRRCTRTVTSTAPLASRPAWRLPVVYQGRQCRPMQRMTRFLQMKAALCEWRSIPQNIHRGRDSRLHWSAYRRETSAARHQSSASRPYSPLVAGRWLQAYLKNEFYRASSWRQSSWPKRCDHAELPLVHSHSERWLRPRNYGSVALTILCFAAV